MAQKTVVKKVKAFPFAGQLKALATGAIVPVQIKKLTHQGVMLELAGTNLQAGEKVEVNFVTPVLNGSVNTSGVIVKIYNQLTGGSVPLTGQAPIRLFEIHFRSVENDSMAHITNFLNQIGHVGKGSL